ncbi:hypothetical protein HID58_087628 [Brassica napus]|uniref:BnaC09g29990D protein n=2 Tax=Brassica napus TaxID=3708 RepID=A0A078G106_BRANA|nr:hypothetical protein HID58_087628 [Brassica napus]CAF1757455.1 unnamed protein product [Brassica napus]CDY20240.1 BnaC09g29990D [Brassica napus]
MDLDCHSFSSFDAFVSCTNMFFDKHKASWISKLRLSIRTPVGVDDTTYLTPWIDSAITHNIQHLDVHFSCLYKGNDPGVVSLPCLKIMQLEYVKYPNEATFVKLISGSPVLEYLTVIRAPTNNSNVLIVCSQTLKRIYINQFIRFDEQNGVVIDAPLLEILMIKCYLTNNLKIINLGLTPKIDIDIPFITIDVFDANDSSKRSVVHNFFASISRARCLAISHATVKVIEKLEPQLQFSYLSQLSASFSMFDLKMLPRILRSCPKLKSLILELVDDRHRKNGEPTVMFSSVPPCLISSLKFVELKSPILGYEGEIELVRYFLKNSRVLEKLNLRFKNHNRKKSKHVILQELLAIPRFLGNWVI